MGRLDSLRWGITFLQTDTNVSWEDREVLMVMATQMYLRKERTRRVNLETFEGRISTKGKYELLVTFYGQRFDAEGDTEEGKANLRFLVTEKIRAGSN
ncbi:MAG: hypothetical protein HYS32_03135 [Candidatus Woesearchaeota archaeon]|nr:MAG: hypothetical protein HYS32_03135 [Candidatus Woesearchaeota archaeon]